MLKHLGTIALLLSATSAYTQDQCPEGYESRKVSCNGQYVVKCVPINYKCDLCWVVEYGPCPGRKFGGKSFKSSYEGATQDVVNAQRQFGKEPCSWWDPNVYKIYLDDRKLCSGSKLTVQDDFISHFSNLYDSWAINIANSIARLRGYTGNTVPPDLTSTTVEWASEIQEAERRSERLKELLLLYHANKTTELMNEMKGFENEALKFKESSAIYETKLSSNNGMNSAWIQLADGYKYRVNPNGSYSFFDGIDQIETFKGEMASQEISRHNNLSQRQSVTNDAGDEELMAQLKTIYQTLLSQLEELKRSGGSSEVNNLESELRKLEAQLKELEKELKEN